MPSLQVGLIAAFEAACAEVRRDPAKVGTSAGISVAPMAWKMTIEPDRPAVSAMSGSPQEIEAGPLAFRDACFTQVEIILEPQTLEAPDSMARVLALAKKG